MKKIIFIISFFCFVQSLHAQELNCKIQVNYNQLPIADDNLFIEMQNALFEFMNNRKWTNESFKIDERIDCSILINLTERAGDNYKATIQITSRRPIFGTNYNSTVFSHMDKDFTFTYQQFEQLEFAENAFISNLTSVLAYYAYIIIAYDYDTFSKNGGTPYFQKALAIVNNAQSVDQIGWKAFESEFNRYWIVENHLNNRFSGFRSCLYEYHRIGMDNLGEKTEEARANILEALKKLRPVYNAMPNSVNLQIFFQAKVDEIVNIFTKGTPNQKNEATTLLTEINPANISKYSKIATSDR